MTNPAPSSTYPKIDSDPEFGQVVRYFRLSDYLTIGGSTVLFPTLLTLFEKFEPANGKHFIRPNGSILRLTMSLGFLGGFFIAYNNSTKRFWGWEENSTELKKFKYEIKEKLVKNEEIYGKSSLNPWLQDVAARNSTNSQLFLSLIPWFNFVKHGYHDNENLINEIKSEIKNEQN